MHHNGLQLNPSFSLRRQDSPRSISAGARVNFSCAYKLPNNFWTRVDPDNEEKSAMHLAWLNDHVGTMAELAKYTEADPQVRTSSVWLLVEREQERR